MWHNVWTNHIQFDTCVTMTSNRHKWPVHPCMDPIDTGGHEPLPVSFSLTLRVICKAFLLTSSGSQCTGRDEEKGRREEGGGRGGGSE